MLRLRQAVLAARDLDAAVAELRSALPLGEPYADPGVAYFGLRNAVMPLGDTFVEVVAPVEDGTAAGRFLDRRGDGAYMAMFQIDDLAAARARAASLGVREVLAIELDDISAVHLHPADMGAAIVSLDRPVPPESWRWGGPWRPHGEAHTAGLTLLARDPEALAARWRTVLGSLDLDGDRVEVRPGEEDAIAAFHVSGMAAGEIHAAGATFRCIADSDGVPVAVGPTPPGDLGHGTLRRAGSPADHQRRVRAEGCRSAASPGLRGA